jgi:hypothetical protein
MTFNDLKSLKSVEMDSNWFVSQRQIGLRAKGSEWCIYMYIPDYTSVCWRHVLEPWRKRMKKGDEDWNPQVAEDPSNAQIPLCGKSSRAQEKAQHGGTGWAQLNEDLLLCSKWFSVNLTATRRYSRYQWRYQWRWHMLDWSRIGCQMHSVFAQLVMHFTGCWRTQKPAWRHRSFRG